LLDHPNSGAGLIPGRAGQCPVERDLYTVLGNLVKTGKDRSKVLLRFFEALLDHPNSGAGLIPGRTGQCPVERDLYTVFGNLVKPGKTSKV